MSTRCICTHPERDTVGCDVHHRMPCGRPASEHEERCLCGEFVDRCDVEPLWDTENGDPEVHEYACAGCVESYVTDGVMARVPNGGDAA